MTAGAITEVFRASGLPGRYRILDTGDSVVPPAVPSSEASARMRRVKQRDTAPELAFRAYLREWGIAYRICPRVLPGRPDVANRRRRWAVFIHGCFWHGHENCRLATVPKTNSAFWRQKLAANRARDTRKIEELEALGYLVVVVWQCELGDARALRKVRAVLRRRSR